MSTDFNIGTKVHIQDEFKYSSNIVPELFEIISISISTIRLEEVECVIRSIVDSSLRTVPARNLIPAFVIKDLFLFYENLDNREIMFNTFYSEEFIFYKDGRIVITNHYIKEGDITDIYDSYEMQNLAVARRHISDEKNI